MFRMVWWIIRQGTKRPVRFFVRGAVRRASPTISLETRRSGAWKPRDFRILYIRKGEESRPLRWNSVVVPLILRTVLRGPRELR